MPIERYQKWRDQQGKPFTPVSIDGLELITDRILNKGTAFSKEEREVFHLEGLIPPHINTLEDQKSRVWEGFCAASTDIDKYIYLRSLQDRNETLFYSLLEDHVEEIIPIIYIPTVGIACTQFSHHFQRARGLYVTKNNVDKLVDVTHHFPSQEIKMVVVTDSQGILGIGDTGVGGMAVPIGKLSLYSMGAGIHPSYCLPIALDIGTDNEELLQDPLYLGVGHKRIKGKEYEDFIDKFVTNIKRAFPRAIVQWEDFSKRHSFRILEKYRDVIPSFNDDIQGTGAVVLSGVINAMKIKKSKLSDQVYLIYGAGSGGIGFARQVHAAMVNEGISSKKAYSKIFIVDSKGLILSDRTNLEDFKKPFATDPEKLSSWKLEKESPSLLEIITNTQTTVLIGISGQSKAFYREHIEAMMEYTTWPVIFPLTNPSTDSEAIPDSLFEWSRGKAIVAVGSQYPDVYFADRSYRIGQASNVLAFPGIGLACTISKIKIITDDIFLTAAQALADCVITKDLQDGIVYPRLKDLQKITVRIAVEVLKVIVKRNPDIGIKTEDIHEIVRSKIWNPTYYPYKRV